MLVAIGKLLKYHSRNPYALFHLLENQKAQYFLDHPNTRIFVCIDMMEVWVYFWQK